MNQLEGKLYRILTEDLGNLGELASRFFDAFTLIPAKGYWRGIAENSVVIDIITDESGPVYKLAQLIKEVNHQEAVLVEEVVNTAYLV